MELFLQRVLVFIYPGNDFEQDHEIFTILSHFFIKSEILRFITIWAIVLPLVPAVQRLEWHPSHLLAGSCAAGQI